MSNMNRSVFDCLHSQGLMWDVHDTTSPWIFTAVYSVLSPTAFLLNLFNYNNYEEDRTTETFQNLVKKYGCFGPSSRWY